MAGHRRPHDFDDNFEDDFEADADDDLVDEFDDEFDDDLDDDFDDDFDDDLDDDLDDQEIAGSIDEADDEADDDWDDAPDERELDADRSGNGYRVFRAGELFGDALDDEVQGILSELGDEDDEVALEAFQLPEPTWTVDELLGRLANDPGEIPYREYFALSDLSRSDIETLRRVWPLIQVERRRLVTATLVSAAKEYFGLQLVGFLSAVLDDEDSLVRHAAVIGLDEEDPQPGLLGALVQMTQNDDAVDVRAAAAAALGDYILAGELDELDAALSMRAEEALVALVTNSAEPLLVQCRALESLAYSGEVGIRQIIEDAYYSPEEDMRVSALVAMGRSADIRWRRLVRAELRNPSPAMRAEAAAACGELETKAALPDLLELLDDDDQIVRLSAIFALGRIGGQRATDALKSIAEGDDIQEAEAAEMALEEMLFYSGSEAVAAPLFDEQEVEDDSFDELDPWHDWSDDEDDDLGEYA